MQTKRNTIICDECGLFCKPYDSYTPFGCANHECPEPYDPLHICKKCFPKVKKQWIKDFQKGKRYGDWEKSRAETEAAKKCGLKWIGSSGVGTLGTKNWVDGHQYIIKEKYERLKKLPYYGYCRACGAKNKGGFCSNKKCENTFKNL